MTKGLRVHPPAGNPYPGPQGNQPYPPGYPHYQPPYQPQQYAPGYPPPPMPPPPWQNPASAPRPQRPGAKGTAKYAVIAAGIFGAVMVLAGIFLLSGETGGYFSNGDTVTPTADAHIVFVKKQHLDGKPASSVRCSGTTGGGEELSLSAPSEVLTTTRGAKPTITYLSVADLPTDRGPLTVTCTKGGSSASLDLVLGKPDSSTGPTIFIVGYAIAMAILIAVVIVVRRRYFRRYPQPQGNGQQWQV